jgi:hypothetical protein
MARKIDETAVIKQCLLWYDQPEIMLLKKNAQEYILAVASPSDPVKPDWQYQFVGASMTNRMVSEYQSEKFDLRFALSHANLRRYWIFNYDPKSPNVNLTKISKGSAFLEEALPEIGFFAREHDRIKVVDEFVPDADERFEIDGSWDLGEFSKFYGQVEDIYYILNDVRRYTDGRTSNVTKQSITDAFNRPWRGGGSYKGYYDNIANDNMPTAPLRVGGIQYNSPGFVRIKAKRQPFDDMIALLQSYAGEPIATRKAYTVLYKFLSSAGLLKASADVQISAEISRSIGQFSNALAEKLPGFSYATVKSMTGDNTLVTAKVLLSVYRRLDNLFHFFEQGRVSYEGLEVDALRSDEN